MLSVSNLFEQSYTLPDGQLVEIEDGNKHRIINNGLHANNGHYYEEPAPKSGTFNSPARALMLKG